MTNPIIDEHKISIEDVIDTLPDSWKKTPRIMSPSLAKLNIGTAFIVVEISDDYISLIFFRDNKPSLTESIPFNASYRSNIKEVISKLTPLVDSSISSMAEERNNELVSKNVFADIISSAKSSGFLVIPSPPSCGNRLRFKNADGTLCGDVSESSEGNYKITINNLSDENVKSILTFISRGEINPV